MDDETYASQLRGAVRTDDLRSKLAPADVLAGAQRSGRRAMILRSAGVVAVASAVFLVGGQLLGPAGPGGGIHPAGTDDAEPTVVDLAPGVRATAEVGLRVLADGTHARTLGLTAANVSTTGRGLAVVPNDGANAPFEEAPWRDNAMEIALLDGDVVAQRQYWDRWVSHAPLTEAEREYWTRDGAPTPGPLDRQLMAGLPPALGSDEGWAMAWPFDDGTWLIVGYMPPDAGEGSEARVVLRKPLATADGGSARTLDLPTFDAGAADGRLMFAATISPELGVPTPTEGDDAVYLLERIPVVAVPPSNG